MDRELIERMAVEAGFGARGDGYYQPDLPVGTPEVWLHAEYVVGKELARFAALVAEHCAQAVEALERHNGHTMPALMHAAEIRAMFSPQAA